MIYFDYAATTPVDGEALDIFVEASKRFYGNASSLHDIGSAAKQLLELSRQELASLLNVEKKSVIFTSGGTESNILSIQTILSTTKLAKNHIIASSTEHSSISNFLNKIGKEGYEISYLKHNSDGIIDIRSLHASINPNTCMIIVSHLNSEIGCIQPISEIRKAIDGLEIFLHTDCVQSFGKIDLKDVCSAADSISISSHKLYGPKGAGAVIFPNIHRLTPPLSGTSHESGFRAGTVNVPLIASFVTAAKKICNTREMEWLRVQALRSLFFEELQKQRVCYEPIESCHHQLPHIIGLIFPGFQGQYMMLELNRKGYAISTGSACTIDKQEPSRTMKAMGKSEVAGKGLVRISLGKDTTESDIIGLTNTISTIVKQGNV
ncbi:IscS subfamily cysteine desulfurase [Bacillus sp. V5-8f]|uniref:IscS subfamily cysteine desulfurase n=1 Tax=Bacillus sp. V5-8f TaxID=2053044 RepID=UPI000C782F48|nr:IscS subfamily cysteine desulfurase [Bacillus sp. V5-8f]PLT32415.1 cysteine desulfurase [Bacillus sp. V5-8f]